MIKVLVCIPHFFRRNAEDSGMANGSNRDPMEVRLEQFRYCLKQISAVLEPVRFLMGSPGRIAHEQVQPILSKAIGDIVIVTAPENNLLAELGPFLGLRARLWNGPPRQLGYECRRIFARYLGQYELYVFIEDDTTILDPSFFRKIMAFYRAHGEDKILQPNRYELFGPPHRSWRAYLDQPAFRHHRVPERPGSPELVLPSFDGDVLFRKTTDAISGAYIITDGQLRRWIGQPDFQAPSAAELAAGLDPMELTQVPLGGSLPIYRPAPQDLDFLEIHHVPNRLSALKTPSRKLSEYLKDSLRKRGQQTSEARSDEPPQGRSLP